MVCGGVVWCGVVWCGGIAVKLVEFSGVVDVVWWLVWCGGGVVCVVVSLML